MQLFRARACELAIYSAAFLAASLACGGKKNDPAPTAEPALGSVRADSAPPPNATGPKWIVVKASDLVTEYKANEVRADAKYKGKSIAVIGLVGEIKKDAFGSIYITLSTSPSNPFDHVMAYFEDATRAAALNRGDGIAAKCVGDGMILASPILRQCAIVDLPPESSAAPTTAPTVPPPAKPKGKRH